MAVRSEPLERRVGREWVRRCPSRPVSRPGPVLWPALPHTCGSCPRAGCVRSSAVGLSCLPWRGGRSTGVTVQPWAAVRPSPPSIHLPRPHAPPAPPGPPRHVPPRGSGDSCECTRGVRPFVTGVVSLRVSGCPSFLKPDSISPCPHRARLSAHLRTRRIDVRVPVCTPFGAVPRGGAAGPPQPCLSRRRPRPPAWRSRRAI